MQDVIISRESLVRSLGSLIREIDGKNIKLISPIFIETKIKIKDTIMNIIRNQYSDITIFYGINHNLSHILIKELLETFDKDINTKFVYLNSFIHFGDDNVKIKILEDLGFKTKKKGLDLFEKLFNDLTIKDNLQKTSLYVIYFENIEILFQKQKQQLFYTILELVSKTKNIFFAGTTRNFNIMESMEKRIRSRFIQRPIDMSTPNLDKIMASIEVLAKEKEEKKRTKIISNSQTSIEIFFSILLEIKPFLKYFKRLYELGYNVTAIMTEIKIVFANFLYELINQKKNFIEKDKVHELIENNITELKNEFDGLSFIENLTKFNVICLASLLKCTRKNIDKITAHIIYNEYLNFITGTGITPIDILLMKKTLQELSDLGLISINPDQKFSHTYELKYPNEELINLMKHERFSKDKNLSLWLYDKKEK